MTTHRRGYIVALEGPDEIVSVQFALLPESASILKIVDMKNSLMQHEARLSRHGIPQDIGRYVWGVDRLLKARYKRAETFLAASAPDSTRLVFMNGGAVAAQRACANVIRKRVPAVRGDITQAEVYLRNIIKGGILRLSQTPTSPSEDDLQDVMSTAMRLAEELDARTASLQPEPSQFEPVSDHQEESRNRKQVESHSTERVHDTLTVDAPPLVRIPSDSTSADRSSGHLSTAQELHFQRARLVPLIPSKSDPLAPEDGETSDVSLGSDGRRRSSKVITESKRNETLMFLEGDRNPDVGFEPVLPMMEDVVFLFVEDNPSITLHQQAKAYTTGGLRVGDQERFNLPTDEIEDRSLEFLVTTDSTPLALQNDIRSELKAWLVSHDASLDFRIFEPLQDKTRLSAATKAALTTIDESVDLILAVGAQEGVQRESYKTIVQKLLLLGRPDGKAYSRAGRIDFRNLISRIMTAHTSQRLVRQTDNPFENESKTAEVILPHIALHLTYKPTVRFLIIDFAHRHLSTIVALRALIGRQKFKIAGIVVDKDTQAVTQTESRLSSHSRLESASSTYSQLDEPSPLARNPPRRLSFSESDWRMTINTPADATEQLNLSTKVWRALRDADDWYNPGAEGQANSTCIRVAVTSEGKALAPTMTRHISLSKRTSAYGSNRNNYSRPFVPASPPDSAPASPDHPPPPPPKALSSRSYIHTAAPAAPQHPPLPQPPLSPTRRSHIAAPASPEPTIGSTDSNRSVTSKLKDLTNKMLHKRSTTGDDRTSSGSAGVLARKFSVLFPSARGKPPTIFSPHLDIDTISPEEHIAPPQGSTMPMQAQQANGVTVPQSCLQHAGLSLGNNNAQYVEPDDDEEEDESMDEDERRLMGRLGSKRRGGDKASKVLGFIR